MRVHQILTAGPVLALLAGCMPGGPATGPGEGGVPAFMAAAIETDAQGRCHGRDIAPAVIQTSVAHEVESPAVTAPDGTVVAPAVYRSTTRQAILREREEVLFETLCPPAYTREFVSSLQRALSVRGFYDGPVSGVVDIATGRAIQDFQREVGPDSPLLSLAAARRLGLVELSEDQLEILNAAG